MTTASSLKCHEVNGIFEGLQIPDLTLLTVDGAGNRVRRGPSQSRGKTCTGSVRSHARCRESRGHPIAARDSAGTDGAVHDGPWGHKGQLWESRAWLRDEQSRYQQPQPPDTGEPVWQGPRCPGSLGPFRSVVKIHEPTLRLRLSQQEFRRSRRFHSFGPVARPVLSNDPEATP